MIKDERSIKHYLIPCFILLFEGFICLKLGNVLAPENEINHKP
jgi:hypothetical protein